MSFHFNFIGAHLRKRLWSHKQGFNPQSGKQLAADLKMGEKSQVWFGKRNLRKSFKRTAVFTLVSILGMPLVVLRPNPASAATTVVDDIPSGGISFNEISASCANPLTRSFNVTSNFTIQDVNLGFNADHTFRGDIQLQLRHPDGTTVRILDSVGNDGSPGYDLLFDDQSTLSPNNFLNDTGEPFYNTSAAPSNPLSAFNGKSSQGVWELEICDTFNGDSGQYNRSTLILSDTDPEIVPAITPNPDYSGGCDTSAKVALILDSSGSVDNTEAQLVREAVADLLTEFSSEGTQVGIVEFAETAQRQIDFTSVTPATIASTFQPYLTNSYPDRVNIGGLTNWEAALQETLETLTDADAVIFITDGNPNTYLNEQIGNTPVSDSDNTFLPVTEAIRPANELKANGTHIYAFGITTGVDVTTLFNVADGTNSIQFDGTNALTADFEFVTNFSTNALATSLVDLGQGLCATAVYDYGDAPAEYDDTDGNGTIDGGDTPARHTLGQSVYLGSVTPDSETLPQSSNGADGDDNDETLNDEDGVQIGGISFQGTTLTAGEEITLEIATQGTGVLNAWVDWNGDGSFGGTNEQIATDADVSGGTLNVMVPDDATTGVTYARFRYSSTSGLGSTGDASDGEVEDYQVAIATASTGMPNQCPSSQQGGLVGTGITPFISGEVGADNATNRDLAIALDDSWRSAAGTAGFSGFQPWIETGPDESIGESYPLLTIAEGADVDVFVTSLNMTDIDTCLGERTGTGTQLAENPTLQDNAPRPNATVADPAPDLFDTNAQPRFWNQTGGANSSRNGVLFEFSSPVAAFGAWFGDLETRTDADGVPAILRLLDENDVQIGEDQIIEPDPSFFTSQNECGGTNSSDITGCGNSTTRWIGFVDPLARVSKMIVIVGDDDPMDDGGSERISFIGATLANAAVSSNPNLILVKRITAIASTPITGFEDGPGLDDNNPLWPANYLQGAIDAGPVLPGDEIEYTIYFLSSGESPAEDVRICDRIQPGQTFQLGTFDSGNADVQLQFGDGTGGNIFNLTAANDGGDRAEFLLAGTEPNNCFLKASNDNGTLVLDITGTVGSPNLPELPNAVSAGTPNNSYGFLRFTTKVNE